MPTLRSDEWTSRHEKSGLEVIYSYKEMDTEHAIITAEIKGGSVRLLKHPVKPPMVRRQVEAYFEREIGESKR
jgi:hypothetical protein